jgi:hypothetical protein
MGEPEPLHPDDGYETDETRVEAARMRAREEPPARPDWLVGADIGELAERTRMDEAVEPGIPHPTLIRPEPLASAPPAAGPAGIASSPRPPGPPAPANPPPEKRVAWTAAASSVPTLRVVMGGSGAAAEPIPGSPPSRRSPPPDARFAPPPDQRGAPAPRLRAVPLDGPDERERAFPDDTTASPAAPTLVRAAPRPQRTSRPAEAWWMVALDALRTERRVQILAALVVVLAAVITFWPRSEATISLSEIRRDPRQWDRRAVRVGGKVGEVYPVGGGFAFYLHQGRDTMVVFTRSRMPRTGEHVELSGSVSTGWLDGAPRQAVFETAAH